MTHSLGADNRLRVALATTELSVGGAERCLVQLAIGLDRRRFAPVVYSLCPAPIGAAATLVDQLQAAGVPVHFLDVRSRWQFLTAIGRLRQLFAQQHPHLVQSFLFHANVVGTQAARRAGVPHILTGIRVADPRRGRHRLERWFAGRVDRIVCVSESVADFSRTHAGLPSHKLVVIPNGIDVARYQGIVALSAEQLGTPPNRRLLVSIGRLDPQKGLDWLLPLAQRFLPVLPAHDLLLVGAGPEESRLRGLAGELGIVDRVHFAGWRPPAQIPGILAACDVVLIPSRWEGMPNVLLEAMAAARPVVATAVEGVVEVLGPLATRQTAPPGDDAAFIHRVLALTRPAASDPDWGQLNRARVEERFSLAAMIRQYERLFEEVAARHTDRSDSGSCP